MIKDPELLKLAVKGIEAEPRRWNQKQWNCTIGGYPMGAGEEFEIIDSEGYRTVVELQDLEHCGTTMCLAGHTVVAAGYRPLAGWQGIGACIDPETKEMHSISILAAELLGLDQKQRHDLFYSGYEDTVSEFKQRITEVTGVEFE